MRIKKGLSLLIAALFIFTLGSGALNNDDISAKSAVLIDSKTGTVLYAKNIHERLPMASTTKIMTAIVAIENSNISDVVTVSKEAVGVEGSSIYLCAQEKLSMENLLYALLLESANDVAAAIAIEVAGSIDAFAELMNSKAQELGLENTHFTNPHGLDNEEHYTTAYELAKVAAYAMKNETFSKIVSTYKLTIPLNGSDGVRLLINHNKLLNQYDGAMGIKTGFTKRSGRCLVSFAERETGSYIAVTLNAPNDWTDHKLMLDYAFENYETAVLAKAGEFSFEVPVVGGIESEVKCENLGGLEMFLEKNNKDITVTKELKRFYYAPVSEGDIVGYLKFYNKGELVGTLEITAAETVEKKTVSNSFWNKLITWFK